jgi:hypothetical protein
MTQPAVAYYAAIASDTATVEDPSGVFRTLDPAGLDAESFGQDGTWHFNDWFMERRNRGTEVGTVEPITAEQAAVIIHRWRDTGVVPKVEGVDIPPLPTGAVLDAHRREKADRNTTDEQAGRHEQRE